MNGDLDCPAIGVSVIDPFEPAGNVCFRETNFFRPSELANVRQTSGSPGKSTQSIRSPITSSGHSNSMKRSFAAATRSTLQRIRRTKCAHVPVEVILSDARNHVDIMKLA